jgi:uncharacterized protein DUF4382/carboxypeptidase family protein
MKTAFSARKAALVATVAGLAALTAAGCGSSGSGSSAGSGQFTVLMSDAPPNLGNVTEVNVTISKVEVHPSTSGTSASPQQPGTGTGTADQPEAGAWKTVFQGTKTFNLLTLANVKDVTTLPHLVDGGLTAGHYDQLRLIVDSATIKVDGQTSPLTIPSGGNTGLKTQPFDVASQQDTVLVLDFDVSQSVIKTGNGQYMLHPVIRLAPVTLTASLAGKVVDATGAPMGAQVTLKDAAGNVVGSSITTVSSPAAATDGQFAIHGIPSGTYTLEVAAQGYTTATQPVTLTAPNMTDAGSVTLTAAASPGP